MIKIQATLICDNACNNGLDKYALIHVSMHMNGIYTSASILDADMPKGWINMNGKMLCPTCSVLKKE